MEAAPRLSTPEEELAYLRNQVAEKEAALKARDEADRIRIISEKIRVHHAETREILAPEIRVNEETLQSEADAIRAELALGETEGPVKKIQEMLETKGIKNALAMVAALKDDQVTDDFHRYLVRYIAAGLPAHGLNEDAPQFRALRMTLFEIILPLPKNAGEGDRKKPLKEQLSRMEQLYAGLLSISEVAPHESNHFAFELAVPAHESQLHFYAAVPNSKTQLFEKQVLAIYPDARIEPQPIDYNVFSAEAHTVIASARLEAHAALPLKTYDEFDHDPMHALLNAFTKIETSGEGAAIQFVIEPRGNRHVAHYDKILHALRKGEKRASAFSTPETMLGDLARDFGRTLFSTKPKDAEKAKEAETRQIEENKAAIEAVERKIAAPIVGVTLRIAISSKSESDAVRIEKELESAFNQFANTQGNRLSFTMIAGAKVREAAEAFSFRMPNKDALPLSLRELATLYHFPGEGIENAAHLKLARTTQAPPPLGLPTEGILIGANNYRGTKTEIRLSSEDRLRHLYVVGQTGAGKSGLLKTLIMQDIKKGEGCCFIDPHGNDIFDLLAAVPPERYNDVIYFDPANLSRPFGLNFLEYDLSRPEQKTFIVNELLMIFRRLYGDVPESMGPAFEQYFRNAALLVMEDPSSGSTMLDIARVLSNKGFREQKLAKSMNPVVNQFWQEIASQAEGEASLANIVPYITNKFDDFTANDFIRPIVGQQHSSFNFREVIDSKKILLINLSKGRLGERNANLLGLIVVGKLFMAALSRADNPRATYPPFYLYIDEFQNVTTDSVPGILSEARKYKLSLSMAHQFLAQIEEKTRNAVFGNVGNMVVFRVGEEDAEVFEKQFAPVFKASDFVNLENRTALVRILAKGVPQQPFDLKTSDIPAGNPLQIEDLVELSSLTYGRDRATVENSIRERYLSR